MTVTHLMLRWLHIAMGMVGILSGAAAMSLAKGSRGHRWAGNLFFVSMLLMGTAGGTLAATFAPNRGNVMGGSIVVYMVATAWVTVWRKPGTVGLLEVGAALLGLSTAAAGITFGVLAATAPNHRLDQYGPPLYFIFGSVALLLTAFDVRMILRGGVTGAARTSRHLVRMCLAMLMATASFFLGQAKVFPHVVRQSGLLPVPVYLVIGAFLYFLIRVRVWPRLRRLRGTKLVQETV